MEIFSLDHVNVLLVQRKMISSAMAATDEIKAKCILRLEYLLHLYQHEIYLILYIIHDKKTS